MAVSECDNSARPDRAETTRRATRSDKVEHYRRNGFSNGTFASARLEVLLGDLLVGAVLARLIAAPCLPGELPRKDLLRTCTAGAFQFAAQGFEGILESGGDADGSATFIDTIQCASSATKQTAGSAGALCVPVEAFEWAGCSVLSDARPAGRIRPKWPQTTRRIDQCRCTGSFS